MKIHELPDSVQDLFEQGENSYRYIDYSTDMAMDNEQAMDFFLDHIDASEGYILSGNSTQVILQHPDFEEKYVVDSVGLGDFFSSGFDVSVFNND